MNSKIALRIVIVEDEPELRDNLIIGLSAHNLDVVGVENGSALDSALIQQPADVVVLDLGLPGEDGLQIARRLKDNPRQGLIILTARGTQVDRIRGFECGADIYFVKPVNITELAIAIRNLGRRLEKTAPTSWQLFTATSSLRTPSGVTILLTAQECSLLTLLFDRRGTNVSRREIFSTLGLPDDIYSNPRIEVLISRLRSKVKRKDSTASLPLLARHNIGYIFLDDNSSCPSYV